MIESSQQLMRAGSKKNADGDRGRGREAPRPMKKNNFGPIKESTWLDSKYLENNL
jgi:hypothetical protein